MGAFRQLCHQGRSQQIVKLGWAGEHTENRAHHRDSDERFDQTVTQFFEVLNKRLFRTCERVFFLGTCIRHSASDFVHSTARRAEAGNTGSAGQGFGAHTLSGFVPLGYGGAL